MRVQRGEKVKNLKRRISRFYCAHPNALRLSFCGQVLEDNNTLHECKVKNGDNIYVWMAFSAGAGAGKRIRQQKARFSYGFNQVRATGKRLTKPMGDASNLDDSKEVESDLSSSKEVEPDSSSSICGQTSQQTQQDTGPVTNKGTKSSKSPLETFAASSTADLKVPAVVSQQRVRFKQPYKKLHGKRKNDMENTIGHITQVAGEKMLPDLTPKTRMKSLGGALSSYVNRHVKEEDRGKYYEMYGLVCCKLCTQTQTIYLFLLYRCCAT